MKLRWLVLEVEMNVNFNFRKKANESLISSFQNLSTNFGTRIASQGTGLTDEKFKKGLHILPFKDEAQTALFKDPVRTAL